MALLQARLGLFRPVFGPNYASIKFKPLIVNTLKASPKIAHLRQTGRSSRISQYERPKMNSLTIILRAFPAKHRLMPFLQKGKNRDERQHTTVFAFRPHHHFCYPIQLSSVYTVFHVLSFLLMSLALFPTSGHARQSLPENESGFLKPEKRPVGATMIENFFTTISHEVTVFYISSL